MPVTLRRGPQLAILILDKDLPTLRHDLWVFPVCVWRHYPW